jgi:hypothetical protein
MTGSSPPVVAVVGLPLPEIANPALLVRAKPDAPPGRRIARKAHLQLAGAKLDDDDFLVGAEAGWGPEVGRDGPQRR